MQFVFFKMLFAQSELPNIIPPSPNATSFHKYGEYPVSYYTGVPDISIPIYEVQSLKLSCPISIRFHASGFKPNELDGILGLNWSLSTGGMVSRQIIGIPDDMATGMLYNNPRHDLESVSSLFPRYAFEYLESVSQKAVDSEYDIFSYSANNLSGSFILKRNGTILDSTIEPIMISNKKKEKVSVRFNSGGLIESFDVVDENGVTYRFGKSLSGTSATEAISSETPYSGFNTTWLLTDIVSSDKSDTISFRYGAHRVRQTSNDTFSSGVSYLNFEHYVGMAGDPGFYFPYPPTRYAGTTSSSNLFYKVRDLEEIRFNNGKILFNYVPNNDSPLQNYLSSIKIYDDKNQQIKDYNFHVSPYTSTRSYRRKLDSMVINGIEKYEFEYNNDLITQYSPLSADWWGYFNGSYFAGVMSPSIVLLNNPMTIGDGVNRDANSSMINYMIKKVIYPTGGSSEFIFEPNYVKNGNSLSAVGGTRIKKITNDDGLGNKTNKEYKYGPNEDGSGIATSPYLDENVLTSNFVYSDYLHGTSNFWETYERIAISPYLASLINYSSPIYYTEVAEYNTANLSLDLGKTIYKYQSIPGSLIQKTDGSTACFSYFLPPISVIQEGFPARQTMSARQNRIISPDRYGLLEKKEVYERHLSAYRLIEEETISYDIETFPEIKSLAVEAKNQYLYNGMDYRVTVFSQTSYSDGPSTLVDLPRVLYAPFLYENCYIQPSTVNLKSKIVKKYFNGQMVENGVEYSYDNSLHGFPTSSLKWNKNYSALGVGKMAESIYKRALEKSAISPMTSEQSLAIDSMISKNMIAAVIEEDQNLTTREEVVGGYRADGSKRKRTNYKIWDSNGQIIEPKDVQISTSNLPLETVTEFHAYDGNGNTLGISKKDGPQIVYVWGYNHKYPIAEVTNADYQTVHSLLGGDVAVNTFNALPYPTDQQIDSYLSALRGGLSNAMVKTFTYYPLVGIKRATDAKGMNTYYEYDNSQRLLNIKDHNEDIIKNYKYNYKQDVGSAVYYNSAATHSFQKNNCPIGQTGSMVNYTVTAGAYSAATQEEAQALATADISANGQAYANANGICSGGSPVYYNVVASNIFQKNNCPAGQTGASVTYTIPAGIYAAESQVAANNLAIADLSANGQNYANTNGNCISGTVYYNALLSQNFQKNNCVSGQTGSYISYTVPASTYSASTQIAADNLAAADMTANGQAYANTNGTCGSASVYYNTALSQSFQKNNCLSGQTGSYISYTVPASTYSANTQIAADNLAMADMATNGQTYANTNGTCDNGTVYYNPYLSIPIKKNNCPPGYLGSATVFGIAAGTYSGSTLAAAIDSAYAYLYANAQTYANNTGTCTYTGEYYNTELSQSFQKNNCLSGQTSQSIIYTVPARTYLAGSQSAADSLAIADVAANGQNYANSVGDCNNGIRYAKIEFDNVSIIDNMHLSPSSYEKYGDAYLKLYSDAACTIPYTTTTGMYVHIKYITNLVDNYNPAGISQAEDLYIEVPVNTNGVLIGFATLAFKYYDYSDFLEATMKFEVQPAPLGLPVYTPVN